MNLSDVRQKSKSKYLNHKQNIFPPLDFQLTCISLSPAIIDFSNQWLEVVVYKIQEHHRKENEAKKLISVTVRDRVILSKAIIDLSPLINKL